MCIKMIKVQFQETSFEYFLVIEYGTRRIACQKPPELTPHHTHTHTNTHTHKHTHTHTELIAAPQGKQRRKRMGLFYGAYLKSIPFPESGEF